jgi:hypothetical protein
METLAANPSSEGWVDPGPDPTLECIPMVAPTGFERVRLSIVVPAHRDAQARLSMALAGAHRAA